MRQGQEGSCGNGEREGLEILAVSSKEFWREIVCLVSALTFGLGGYRRWDKEYEQY